VSTIQNSAALVSSWAIPARFVVALIAAFSLAFHAMPSAAVAGDFDRSFGQNGIAVFPTEAGSMAHFVTTDTAGRVLATGKDRGAEFLTRSQSNGTLDTTFNGTGYLRGIINVPNSDGRLIVGHTGLWVTNTVGGQVLAARMNSAQCPPELCRFITPTIQLRRLNLDGSTVNAANADIAATVGIEESMQVIEDSRGGFLFATQTRGLVFSEALLTRIGADGLRDTAFKPGICPSLNKVAGSFGSSTKALPLADGRTMLAHEIYFSTTTPNPNHLCLSRVNADGSADKAYAVNGDLILDSILSSADVHRPVAMFATVNGGSALLLQQINRGSQPLSAVELRYTIMWLTPQGALDTARSDRGITAPTDQPIGQVVAATMQRDGKIVIVGYPASATPGPNFDYFDPSQPRVARLTSQGGIDSTFGAAGQGFVSLVTSGKRLIPKQLHIAQDGSIFVAGATVDSSAIIATDEPTQFAIAKLHADPPPSQPVVAPSNGGGGCGTTTDAHIDPVLPSMAMLALLGLWIRRRNKL
jgi:uncharacterized delta-60 repeat protein/uncharacterized protein (TIGR03382 family)